MWRRTSYSIVFLGIAFALVGVAILRLVRPQATHVYAQLREAPGVKEGAQVAYRGVAVGKVTRIAFVPDGVLLTLALERSDVPLRQRDGIRLRTVGVFGEKLVELVSGPSAAPALTPETVLGEAPPDTSYLRWRAADTAFLRQLLRSLLKDSAPNSASPQQVKP